MELYSKTLFYDVDQKNVEEKKTNKYLKSNTNFNYIIVEGSDIINNKNNFNSILFELKLLLLLVEIHISLNEILINLVNNDILLNDQVKLFQDKLNLYQNVISHQNFGFIILNSEKKQEGENQYSNALLNKDPLSTFQQEEKEKISYREIMFELLPKNFNTKNVLFVGSDYLNLNFYPQDISLSTIDTPYNSIIVNGSDLNNNLSDENDKSNEEKMKILREILFQYIEENNFWIVYFQYKVFQNQTNKNQKFESLLNEFKSILNKM